MDIIEIIILAAITISGTVFGSFFTLAVHRIPKKQDITHERSYCPKCNHKLQFLDLIPVFSYLFLGGKCRYCKEKIRPRYVILEISSGLVFLLLALSYGIGIETSIGEYIQFALLILFLCSVFIVAGIDRESYTIPNGVLLYGFGISIVKVVLEVCKEGNSIVPNLVGFLAFPIMLWMINWVFTKCFQAKETPFGGGDIKYLAVLGLFGGFGMQLLIIELSFLMIAIDKVYEKLIKKEKRKIAWGYDLSIAAVILFVVAPHITNLIESLNFMLA